MSAIYPQDFLYATTTTSLFFAFRFVPAPSAVFHLSLNNFTDPLEMSGETTRPRRSRKSIAFQPNASGAAKDAPKPAAEAPQKKKSRSKSLGPGGLDALNAEESKRNVLKNGNGNGRRTSVSVLLVSGVHGRAGADRDGKMAPGPPVKSILMPTLPLSPLKEIPAHRPRTQLRGAPLPPPPVERAASSSQQPASIFQPPPPQTGQPTATIPLRTEEEQQKRAEILAARAARRQSLGNRRVSFAPEATLHTWDVIDYRNDGESTPGSSVGGSSRASTPGSNRRSSGAGAQATPTPGERPSTPPDQIDHDLPEAPTSSSARAKRSRRASVSGARPAGFNSPDADFGSSSPFSSPTGNEAAFVEEEVGTSDSSDEDAASGDRTFVSVAGETTMGEGEMTFAQMDTDVEDETARKPIFKKPMQWTFEGGPSSSPPAPPPPNPTLFAAEEVDDGEGEATMDVTKAVGGLLSASDSSKAPGFSFSPSTPQNAEPDDGEMTMDMTRPVGGLLASWPAVPPAEREEEGEDLMDFTRPVGGILSAGNDSVENDNRPAREEADVDETMDMDITRPIGGILSSMANRLRKSIGFGMPPVQLQQEQQQQQQQEEEEEDEPESDEMDMDITRAIGGIVSAAEPSAPTKAAAPPAPTTTSETDMNEDMTMELTSVLGGIIGQAPKQTGRRRSSLGTGQRGGLLMSRDHWAKDQAAKQSLADRQQQDGEAEMDMTVAVGGILPAAVSGGGKGPESEVTYPELDNGVRESEAVTYPTLPEPTQDGEDQEMGESPPMDVTANFGRILRNSPKPVKAASPKEIPVRAPALAPSSEPVPSPEETPAADSPTPVNRQGSRSSSGAALIPATQRITRGAHRRSLEQNKATPQVSPQKGLTPKQPTVAAKKSTPAKAASTKPASPPQDQPKQTATSTIPDTATPQKAKAVTPQTKAKSPLLPATPQTPALPGEQSPIIKPSSKTPTKKVPTQSTPRRTLRHKQAETAPPSNQLQTPPKGIGLDRPGLGSPVISEKLSRRKSIGEDTMAFSPVALPSALVLACRMDAQRREREAKEDKERRDQEEKTMDLRSKIQLLTPMKPTGRMSLAIGSLGPGKRPLEDAVESGTKRRKSADGVSVVEAAGEENHGVKIDGWMAKTVTPGLSRHHTSSASSTPISGMPAEARIAVSFGDDKSAESSMLGDDAVDQGAENISLQEFLRAIDVSFLELTATKRRHAGFKTASARRSTAADDGEASLADRIKAGACTAPMLEMFQHLSRDLQKHIEEGREVIKDIEEITQAENPPLFQEYLQAPPDIKATMDIQFKNIKTNARLTAKGEWYEWRMKNMGPVKETLQRNLGGLQEDERFVQEQLSALSPLLPDIKKAWEKARSQLRKLEEMRQRIDMDDQDELQTARSQLSSILGKIETVRAETEQMRQQVQALDREIEAKEAKEAELVASIEEAERIKEMNRGWSENEVRTWRTRCSELEKSSGWSITKALPDGRLELTFMRQVKLLLDPLGQAAPEVEYTGPAGQKPPDCRPIPELESRFFITGLNAILSEEREPRTVLRNVSSYWQDALVIINSIRRLRTHHHTDVEVSSDGNLRVKATVLVQELRSKMEVSFVIGRGSLSGQGVGVRVVYGAISQQAVQDALVNWAGEWREGVSEVVERCLEGRRRGGVVVGVRG